MKHKPTAADEMSKSDVSNSDVSKSDVSKSDVEWQETLSPQEYRVLRQHGTEPAWSHPFNGEHREGRFLCAGCGAALFSSEAKYESGSGWPSYVAPLENAVDATVDRSHGMVRTEVHCRRCGGHLGHLFEDGPTPTGLRYCTNGTSLKFLPTTGGTPTGNPPLVTSRNW